MPPPVSEFLSIVPYGPDSCKRSLSVRFIGWIPLYTNLKKNKGGIKNETQENLQPSENPGDKAAYFARKALDVMTAIASGFGLFSAVIFLVTMI